MLRTNMIRTSPILPLLLLLILSACRQVADQVHNERFTVSSDTLDLNRGITAAVWHVDHILCLDEDDRLIVLDSLGRQDSVLSSRLQDRLFNEMAVYRDTVLVTDKSGIWWIADDFGLYPYKRGVNQFKYGFPMYADSAYEVFGCGVGEWGGAVFFYDRRIDTTYTCAATAPQQVLRVGDRYIVSNYLAHLSGHSDFLAVADPRQLYVYSVTGPVLHCNWYYNDTLAKRLKNKTVSPSSAKTYGVPVPAASLTSFVTDTSLYSIYTTRSGTYLARHSADTLVNTDTLLSNQILAGMASTSVRNGVNVTGFSYFSGWQSDDGKMHSRQSGGLIVIRGRAIRFLFAKEVQQ